MPDRIEALRETLLRAGLAPAHIERYLRELSEHRSDIVDHLVAAGRSYDTASVEADRRLGSTDALLLPMLADRRFRSLAARWPAACYVAVPLLCQLALVLTGLVLLIAASRTPLRPAIPDLGSLLALTCLAAPAILAWLTLAAARRRRAPLFWPVVGALSGALLAATLNISVVPPLPGQQGEIAFAMGLPTLLPLLTLSILSLLPISIRN